MTEQQAAILEALANRLAGYTARRAGTRGYALKVNNMRRKAAAELVAAGMTGEAAEAATYKIQRECGAP